MAQAFFHDAQLLVSGRHIAVTELRIEHRALFRPPTVRASKNELAMSVARNAHVPVTERDCYEKAAAKAEFFAKLWESFGMSSDISAKALRYLKNDKPRDCSKIRLAPRARKPRSPIESPD